MLYLILIPSLALLVASVNMIFPSLCGNLEWWQVLLITAGLVITVIAVDGLMATLTRWVFPSKWFGRGTKLVRVHKWEKNFYMKIGVKKWKDYIPEWGGLAAFRKDKIYDPTNNEYVLRYITEANIGAFGHLLGMIFGFAIVAIYPQKLLSISIPIAVINFIISSLSLIILRFNLPKLEVLYQRNLKREKKA